MPLVGSSWKRIQPTVVDLDDKVKIVGRADVIFSGNWWLAWPLVLAGAIAWAEQASSGAASATGERGAASATGESGAASATGGRGAASATGERGAASATGGRGAASATGGRGIAAVTGDDSTVEAGPGGICAVTADEVTWIVHPEDVLIQRWQERKKWRHKLLTPRRGWKAGDRVLIKKGRVVRVTKAERRTG